MPDQLTQLLLDRLTSRQPIEVVDDRPLFGVPLKTERTQLLRDDREDKRQSPVNPLYAPPANATPSLLSVRRQLPSTALAFQPMDKGEMIIRMIQKGLNGPQSKGGPLNNYGRKDTAPMGDVVIPNQSGETDIYRSNLTDGFVNGPERPFKSGIEAPKLPIDPARLKMLLEEQERAQRDHPRLPRQWPY